MFRNWYSLISLGQVARLRARGYSMDRAVSDTAFLMGLTSALNLGCLLLLLGVQLPAGRLYFYVLSLLCVAALTYAHGALIRRWAEPVGVALSPTMLTADWSQHKRWSTAYLFGSVLAYVLVCLFVFVVGEG